MLQLQLCNARRSFLNIEWSTRLMNVHVSVLADSAVLGIATLWQSVGDPVPPRGALSLGCTTSIRYGAGVFLGWAGNPAKTEP